MKIKTKRSFETKVDFSEIRSATVSAGHNQVDLRVGIAYMPLEIEDARFLADLLNEAADVAQENEDSLKGEPEPDIADDYPFPSADWAGTSKDPLNLRTSVTFPVSASDVHGWSKDGGVRI